MVIWVVAPSTAGLVAYTHTGGQKIHLLPVGLSKPTVIYLPVQSDPISTMLTPRRFCQPNTWFWPRRLFRIPWGAGIYVSGRIAILFQTQNNVEGCWLAKGLASTFGGLWVLYDIAEYVPSTQTVDSGDAVATGPNNNTAMGLIACGARRSRIGKDGFRISILDETWVHPRNEIKPRRRMPEGNVQLVWVSGRKSFLLGASWSSSLSGPLISKPKTPSTSMSWVCHGANNRYCKIADADYTKSQFAVYMDSS